MLLLADGLVIVVSLIVGVVEIFDTDEDGRDCRQAFLLALVARRVRFFNFLSLPIFFSFVCLFVCDFVSGNCRWVCV